MGSIETANLVQNVHSQELNGREHKTAVGIGVQGHQRGAKEQSVRK